MVTNQYYPSVLQLYRHCNLLLSETRGRFGSQWPTAWDACRVLAARPYALQQVSMTSDTNMVAMCKALQVISAFWW